MFILFYISLRQSSQVYCKHFEDRDWIFILTFSHSTVPIILWVWINTSWIKLNWTDLSNTECVYVFDPEKQVRGTFKRKFVKGALEIEQRKMGDGKVQRKNVDLAKFFHALLNLSSRIWFSGEKNSIRVQQA